ncbi:MAG: amidase [Pseudomonadota bacterium]
MQDATALAAAIDLGRTSASEAMAASLAACAAREDLGAIVHLDHDMARAGAAAADDAAADGRGPFHGVPFLMKDLGSTVAGLPSAAGALAFRRLGRIPEVHSDFGRAIRAAGLIPFGVTATPPFGLSLSCEAEGLPPTCNPWDKARTPGGSSGGAAAAVAAGLVALAHATDAAGSIRVPAACCGLTGLKPSRGAMPGGPGFENYLMGIAAELVLARSVRDVATAFAALAYPMPRAPLPQTPRIGLARPARCDMAQLRAAKDAAKSLEAAGCTLHDVDAPDALGAAAHGIAHRIFAVSQADWLSALNVDPRDVPALAAAFADEGRAMPATALFALTREMEQVADSARALFAEADALVMPVLAHAPPPVGTFALDGKDPAAHMARLEAFAPNAALANVAGLPALALPFGMDEGLPLGVQLVGPRGADGTLLHLAALVEARAPALSFPAPIAGLPA